jgi:hypothetical protein
MLVEQEQQLSVGRPGGGVRGIERRHRAGLGEGENAAMQYRAGEPRQVFGVHLPIGLVPARKLGTEGTNLRLESRIKEQALDALRGGGEHCRDCGQSGNAQELAIVVAGD